MKLSKQTLKNHNKALELAHSDKPLRENDRDFILRNYREDADHQTSWNGAFFTPVDLCSTFALCVGHPSRSVIDLCAGIGRLSYFIYQSMSDRSSLTCVEYNPTYADIGRRLMPDANWITGSVLEFENWFDGNKYRLAISNPPFGNPSSQRGNAEALRFNKKSVFELQVVEIAAIVASTSAFILPQGSVPFRLTGERSMTKQPSVKYKEFHEKTGLELQPLVAVDCSEFEGDWNGCKPVVEFAEIPESHNHYRATGQTNLFQTAA